MKVKELIELLQTVNPEHEVVLSKDSEGNHYSPLTEGWSEVMYEPETTWYGEVTFKDDFDNEQEEARDEFERFSTEGEFEPDPWEPNAIVLWPVN